MITGNATALLNQRRDQILNITTPAIAAGTNLSIHLVPKPALVLGLITQYGPDRDQHRGGGEGNPAGNRLGRRRLLSET